MNSSPYRFGACFSSAKSPNLFFNTLKTVAGTCYWGNVDWIFHPNVPGPFNGPGAVKIPDNCSGVGQCSGVIETDCYRVPDWVMKWKNKDPKDKFPRYLDEKFFRDGKYKVNPYKTKKRSTSRRQAVGESRK